MGIRPGCLNRTRLNLQGGVVFSDSKNMDYLPIAKCLNLQSGGNEFYSEVFLMPGIERRPSTVPALIFALEKKFLENEERHLAYPK